MSENSLRRSAGRGAIWQVLAGGWQALVRLGASTILARSLVPGDFGLFGMALLIIELVDYLGGLGMTGGVIAKKEVGDKELNTCFWTMAGVRFLLFCIAFFAAPLAALFMREPRVIGVVRVVSVTFLISIFGIMGNAILSKKLQFGKISIINAVAIFIESSFAVYLAKTTNLGYWALVYPMLVSSLFTNLSVFIVANWFPKFLFDKESFRFQFKFGIHGLGFNIANYLHQNIDYFIVGRFMGATFLGLYEYAYRIPHMILDRLARPVGAVVFPALSKVQDDDDALIRGYLETVRYVTMIAFPLLGGLAALAKPLVLLLWGPQWLTIVSPLQILCLCSAIRCVVQPTGAVFLCKHRPDIPLIQSVITVLSALLCVTAGIYFFGIMGVALGMLTATFTNCYALIKVFDITNSNKIKLIKAILPNVNSSVVAIFTAYIVYSLINNKTNSFFALVPAIVSSVISYISIYYICFKIEYTQILSTLSMLCHKETLR